MYRGNAQHSQYAVNKSYRIEFSPTMNRLMFFVFEFVFQMRARIGFQGFAVAALIVGFIYGPPPEKK